MEHARHRRDLFAHALARAREQRQDQILRREPCLAHQRPHALAPSQPPGPVDKVTHKLQLSFTNVGMSVAFMTPRTLHKSYVPQHARANLSQTHPRLTFPPRLL